MLLLLTVLVLALLALGQQERATRGRHRYYTRLYTLAAHTLAVERENTALRAVLEEQTLRCAAVTRLLTELHDDLPPSQPPPPPKAAHLRLMA